MTGIKVFTLFLILIFATSFSVMADTYRCPIGGDFAETGDTIGEVADKCGQPTSKNHTVVPNVNYYNTITYTDIEEWYFFKNYNDITRLTFNNGRLHSIQDINSFHYDR